jgi:predicted protein tyrosine phosphatase
MMCLRANERGLRGAVRGLRLADVSVCGFGELALHCKPGVTHAISLLDPGTDIPAEIALFARDRLLVQRFHDVIEDGPDTEAPRQDHVEELLGFARQLRRDGSADPHLLIHCHAGFSRSPAAAILIVAQEKPEVPVTDIVRELQRVRPDVWPNLRMTELGDRMLNRGGEIISAVQRLYRDRLEQQPSLAQLMAKYGRSREVQSAGLL